MDKGGEVSSVVENQVERLSSGESLDGLLHAPNVLLLGLSLPSVDGDTGGGDRGGGLVLGGEDVAGLRTWNKVRSRLLSLSRTPPAPSEYVVRTDQVTAAPRAVRVSMRMAVCGRRGGEERRSQFLSLLPVINAHLDRHVQASGNPGSLERLSGAVLEGKGHQQRSSSPITRGLLRVKQQLAFSRRYMSPGLRNTTS